jgi:hypothetical protein
MTAALEPLERRLDAIEGRLSRIERTQAVVCGPTLCPLLPPLTESDLWERFITVDVLVVKPGHFSWFRFSTVLILQLLKMYAFLTRIITLSPDILCDSSGPAAAAIFRCYSRELAGSGVQTLLSGLPWWWWSLSCRGSSQSIYPPGYWMWDFVREKCKVVKAGPLSWFELDDQQWRNGNILLITPTRLSTHVSSLTPSIYRSQLLYLTTRALCNVARIL